MSALPPQLATPPPREPALGEPLIPRASIAWLFAVEIAALLTAWGMVGLHLQHLGDAPAAICLLLFVGGLPLFGRFWSRRSLLRLYQEGVATPARVRHVVRARACTIDLDLLEPGGPRSVRVVAYGSWRGLQMGDEAALLSRPSDVRNLGLWTRSTGLQSVMLYH